MNSRTLQDGTNRTTGDNTGTRGGGAQQHNSCCGFTLHRVRNGLGDAGHAEEVLFRFLYTLRNRQGHLAGLAVSNADHSLTVSHHDQSSKREASTTLDHLGDTVDRDNTLKELALVTGVTRSALHLGTTLAAAATLLARLLANRSLLGGRCCFRRVRTSRLDGGRLCGFGHRFVLCLVAHSSNPLSRAPSAIAATRPA
ncbi:MAG: Uncharacterised protein [Cellulomonadaceae bacterium TMED98]|nr:MAG: Uncharacterised protein [Cellulomonadaceae bacterium TMED98]